MTDREKRPREPEKWVHRPMEKYRKGKKPLAIRPSVEFFALADPYQAWDMRSAQLLL